MCVRVCVCVRVYICTYKSYSLYVCTYAHIRHIPCVCVYGTMKHYAAGIGVYVGVEHGAYQQRVRGCRHWSLLCVIICVWTYVCLHVCMYIDVHVCVYICMCTCVYVCVHM